MIQVNRIQKDHFGSLTTLVNPETGVVMFIAAEAGKMWGHTNITSVTRKILNPDEIKTIKKSDHNDFFNLLIKEKVLPIKAQRIQLITESGLYKFALSSNLPMAKPFINWIASEVLPSIRKYGYYSIADHTDKIPMHTHRSVQIQNSKDVNRKHYIEKGVEEVIKYNKESCIIHSGKSPRQLKEEAKRVGLPATQRKSGKEVLRNTNPGVACAMSFADDMIKKGFDLNTVTPLSKKTIEIFNGMIELGVIPAELYD